MRTEIWKTAIVNGETWENYQVSNLGRILSLNYRNTGRAELLTLFDDGHGYLRVHLYKNEKTDNCRVHRLVAEAFLPNPDNLPYINHKIEGDEGKKMNMVIFNEDGTINKEKTTIEWCDREYNNNYGTHNERIAKALSKPVLQFTLDGVFIREWPSIQECGRNGFNTGAVWRCCRGKLPHYKGFKWQYA